MSQKAIQNVFWKNKGGAISYNIERVGDGLNTGGDYEDKVKSYQKIWVQPKLDGCLSGNTIVELKNHGKLKLKDVVNNKIKDKINSFNYCKKWKYDELIYEDRLKLFERIN